MIQNSLDPWVVEDGRRNANGAAVITARGKVVANANEKDARRIVACVNACRGFTTQGLEQCLADGETILSRLGGWQLKSINAEIKRDELADALKAIKDYVMQHADDQDMRDFVTAATEKLGVL